MVLMLSGCLITPEALTIVELKTSAVEDRNVMFGKVEKLSGPLSLPEAMARAFKHNLDHKEKAMQQALSLRQTDLDEFTLLPTATATAAWTHRDQHAATRSQDVDGAPPTGAFSYSADRSNQTRDFTLSWNILDFGVSYYTAKQNGDRELIAEERRRKILHSLAKEVHTKFWRVAAAQKLSARLKTTIERSEMAFKDAQKVEREKLRAPEEALTYQKRLIENVRQLEEINQQLSTAKIELAALVNLQPGQDFEIVLPQGTDLKLPKWSASLKDMEDMAFQNNPDLRERHYLNRIAVNDTRKALVALLPGIDISGGRNYDSNTYQDINRWYDWSTSVSWNLMNIVKFPIQEQYSKANEQMFDAQRLTLRMAVMAQVHVADRQFHNTLRQYKQADRLFRIEERLADIVTKRQATSAESQLELVAQETSAISSELRRYQAYAEVISAMGQIHSTLGIEVVPKNLESAEINALAAALSGTIDSWMDGSAFKAAQAELKEQEMAQIDDKHAKEHHAVLAQQPGSSPNPEENLLVFITDTMQTNEALANHASAKNSSGDSEQAQQQTINENALVPADITTGETELEPSNGLNELKSLWGDIVKAIKDAQKTDSVADLNTKSDVSQPVPTRAKGMQPEQQIDETKLPRLSMTKPAGLATMALPDKTADSNNNQSGNSSEPVPTVPSLRDLFLNALDQLKEAERVFDAQQPVAAD